MRRYSDFWLHGAVLSAAWADRPDEPEDIEPADQGGELETVPMGMWLRWPEAERQAVVADYVGIPRKHNCEGG